ncbi:MAG: response regulator [Planctomycetota bacterium]|nr:response regulator [Planctomycetota bacterium]
MKLLSLLKLPSLSPRLRIVSGLASLLVSVLLGAMALHLVPDRRTAVMEGRSQLCEAIAVNSSVLVNRDDIRRLQAILTVLVSRHDDILSAGIRKADGELVVDVAHHGQQWIEFGAEYSTDSQVFVPLKNAEGQWGSLELRFQPVHGDIWFEIVHNPWVRLVGFVTSLCVLSWYFYLGRILEQLNPSQSIPGRVRETLDTLAEGLLAIDRKGRIALCNQAFAMTLGEDPDKLVGRKVVDLPWQVQTTLSLGPGLFPWDGVLSGAETLAQGTLRLLASDNTVRIYQVNCAPVVGKEAQVRGVFCCFEDVTELESQKLQLAESRASAEAANQAKSAFLANMSHEIRTPMNAILGFAEVLRRGMYDSPEQQAEYLETIHSSGQHLLRLINDILDLSKVEAGRLEVERIACCPHQLLLEVVTVLKVKADEKQLRMECLTPGGLPEVIETDPGRLRQILTNLIGNSLKFTETGGVSVVAKMLCGTKTRLQIDIIDTGVGISEEARQRIFDPFSQADTSITRRFGGTGLGLTISKRFAESLGGDLTVSSIPGKGSTFTVVIDAGEIDEAARVLDISRFEAEARQASQIERGKRFRFGASRILLVDDGEANRQLIRLVLQRHGLLVETAVNGQEAVDKAATSNYDIILMDMQMPVMDGYIATQTLREQGLEVPIVALTANAMRGDREKCLNAGCSGFLSKPVDLDQLLSYVAELLGVEESDSEICDFLPGIQPATPAIMTESTGRISEGGLDRLSQPPPPILSSADEEAARLTVVSESISTEDCEPSCSDDTEQPRSVTLTAGHHTRSTELLDQVLSEVHASTDDVKQPRRSTANSKRSAKPEFDPYDTANVFPSELTASVSSSKAVHEPIVSELPFDDAEFQEIVIGFVDKLRIEVEELQRVWQRRDLEEVARIAHWLKGAAGTMGFRVFTAPSLKLMELVRMEQLEQIEPVIRELTSMVAAIEVRQPV